jgi:3-methyladenine DNA glycosylase/8-oxoguanine DNA glycosylase
VALPGIGPWTAAYRACAAWVIPTHSGGDLGVRHALMARPSGEPWTERRARVAEA